MALTDGLLPGEESTIMRGALSLEQQQLALLIVQAEHGIRTSVGEIQELKKEFKDLRKEQQEQDRNSAVSNQKRDDRLDGLDKRMGVVESSCEVTRGLDKRVLDIETTRDKNKEKGEHYKTAVWLSFAAVILGVFGDYIKHLMGIK